MPVEVMHTLYKFEELSDQAKERARQWWRECENSDGDWSFMYADFEKCGKIIGIEIDRRTYKTIGGGTGSEPTIYWSGFSSQGDGACFEGRYAYAKDAHNKIRAHAPKDERLHKIADDLLAIQRKHGYRLEARVKHSGHYNHKYCTAIDVTDSRTGDDVDKETYDTVVEALRDFMEWIYRSLEKEYEWKMADEQVDENITANEYTFNAQGKRED